MFLSGMFVGWLISDWISNTLYKIDSIVMSLINSEVFWWIVVYVSIIIFLTR